MKIDNKIKVTILVIFVLTISSIYFFPRPLNKFYDLGQEEYLDASMSVRKRFVNVKTNRSESDSININDYEVIQDVLNKILSNKVIKMPLSRKSMSKSGKSPIYMLNISYELKDRFEHINIMWLDKEEILIQFPISRKSASWYKFFPKGVDLTYLEELFNEY